MVSRRKHSHVSTRSSTNESRVAAGDDSNVACVAAVIVNYGTADLAIQCLQSLAGMRQECDDLRVYVVDNASPDDSIAQITASIARERWSAWVRLLRSAENRGFAAGNNVGIRHALVERPGVDAIWLLNTDTIVRPGALAALSHTLQTHAACGLVGPRLEWPQGDRQQSCFRTFRPATELVRAAASAPISRLFRAGVVALDDVDQQTGIDWISFASVLIRRGVFEQVGLLDEGYFMYYEDVDFCRAAREVGFHIAYAPTARVVHLRGGTSPVKSLAAERRRRPRYYFAARSRFYAKWYGGRWGVVRANCAWHLGRLIAYLRETVSKRQRRACESEWRDIWTNFASPLHGPVK